MWYEGDEIDSQLAEAESMGASDLKWKAVEQGDIKDALEMQRIEREALIRINYEDPDPADYWKK